MTFDEFVDYVRSAVNTMCDSWDELDDDFYPTLFFWGDAPEGAEEEGKRGVTVAFVEASFLDNQETKDRLANQVMPQMILGARAAHWAFTSSAWSSKMAKTMLIEPRNDPDRDEVVSLMAGSGDGSICIDRCLILRADDQPPVLSKWGMDTYPITGNYLDLENGKKFGGSLFDPSMIAVISVRETDALMRRIEEGEIDFTDAIGELIDKYDKK